MAKRKKSRTLDYSVSLLYPRVVFGYKGNEDLDSRVYGFKLENISFGLTYESYDYGHIFEASFFGFGVSIWWIY